MRIVAGTLGLFALLVAAPAFAVDRLVDDQLIPCVSGPLPLHPTISGAVAAAEPGEMILVCAGGYMENVRVDKANLTLRAQGIVHLTAADPAESGIDVTNGGVTVQGFDISGATFGCGVGVSRGISDIRDNRVHGNRWGICIAGGVDHRVRYNVVHDNTYGIVAEFSGPVEISHNTVKDNERGIAAVDCGGAPAIHHNFLTGNRSVSIQVGTDASNQLPCGGARVMNNTVRGPGGSGLHSLGIMVEVSNGVVLTRNLVQDTGTGLYLFKIFSDATVSFNSISFNDVGLDVVSTTGVTVTRNNVSHSTTVDCRSRQSEVGAQQRAEETNQFDAASSLLSGNNCGTQDPAGAFD